jgi:ATP-dependent RNA helicase DDX42
LIATDIASRGLDIKDVNTVINVEVPKDLDTHIHRIGRTGRAENIGTSYSLLTLEDIGFAVNLCKNFELSGQEIPGDLMELALCDDSYKRKKK